MHSNLKQDSMLKKRGNTAAHVDHNQLNDPLRYRPAFLVYMALNGKVSSN